MTTHDDDLKQAADLADKMDDLLVGHSLKVARIALAGMLAKLLFMQPGGTRLTCWTLFGQDVARVLEDMFEQNKEQRGKGDG